MHHLDAAVLQRIQPCLYYDRLVAMLFRTSLNCYSVPILRLLELFWIALIQRDGLCFNLFLDEEGCRIRRDGDGGRFRDVKAMTAESGVKLPQPQVRRTEPSSISPLTSPCLQYAPAAEKSLRDAWIISHLVIISIA